MNTYRIIYIGIWINLICLFSLGICKTEITNYPAEQIRQQIQEYIQNNLNHDDRKYDIEWPQKLGDVSLLNKPDSIQIIHPGEKLHKGYNIIKVSFYSNRKPIKRLHISVKLHLIQKVYILTQTVRKNEMLKPENFLIEEREITSIVGNPIKTNQNISELYAVRTLSKGRILMDRDLRESYCVTKGDRLNIEIRKKTFSIKLQVLALQNGSMGDIVLVKNLENKKRLKVRVAGPELATIL
jgi:flagella basal body P-ring formation protein FlgA